MLKLYLIALSQKDIEAQVVEDNENYDSSE